MNSTFVNSQAKAAAERLLSETKDDATRLDLLFQRALGRAPTSSEITSATKFLAEYKQTIDTLPSGQKPKDATLAAWSAVCLSVFGCNEFRFVE